MRQENARQLAAQVAALWGLTLPQIRSSGPGRSPDAIQSARQIALLLVAQLTDLRGPALSQLFGYRDDSGASLALREARKRLEGDPPFARKHRLAQQLLRARQAA